MPAQMAEVEREEQRQSVRIDTEGLCSQSLFSTRRDHEQARQSRRLNVLDDAVD
jgi:hypothetical protein